MKILELTNYSAGICGVWNRVKEESLRLSKKGHQVRIFSSNRIKGNNKIAKSHDKIDNIKIRRFKSTKIGGESFMSWAFQNEAEKYNPDIIIAHSYRHLHTTRALKVAKKCNSKIFLVTHAPFVEPNTTRGFISQKFINFYDNLIAPGTLKQFDKIIAITKWELPFLLKRGAEKNKIVYIPNGVPERFFKQKKAKEDNKILFLGRISPIKDIETLIKAFKKIKEEGFVLEVVGPSEKDYLNELKFLAKRLGIEKRIRFPGAIYDLKEKIKKIDSAKIFVLPSIRESMPQSLIEAMAREKIVIASDNRGCSELINDEENGFLFKQGNVADLTEKIDFALKGSKSIMKKKARESVEKFRWNDIIKRIESLF